MDTRRLQLALDQSDAQQVALLFSFDRQLQQQGNDRSSLLIPGPFDKAVQLHASFCQTGNLESIVSLANLVAGCLFTCPLLAAVVPTLAQVLVPLAIDVLVSHKAR